MGRQYRSPRRGETKLFNSPAVVTSSSIAIAIPNYGVTNMSTWTDGDYVLDAPVQGVEKTLVSVSSSSVARIVRTSTGDTVSIGNGNRSIVFGQTTIGVAITMLGMSSTLWAVKSAYPIAATAAGLTLST